MIETQRLLIRPLKYEQLLKYIQLDHSLETELQLKPTERTISPELKDALEQTILPAVADSSKDYRYCTLWSIVLKEEQCMVGDLCFIGEPDTAGEIEIGYGTYDAFQKRGIMTEAVGAMILWAKAQEQVRSIFAATEKKNAPSFAVLQKNNFVQVGETEELLHWRLMLR